VTSCPCYRASLHRRAGCAARSRGRVPLAPRRVVNAFVQALVLFVFFRLGSADDAIFDRLRQQLRIMHVRWRDHDAQGVARAIDQDRAFRAVFAAVRGVSADPPPPKRALPRNPSATCQAQSGSLPTNADSFLEVCARCARGAVDSKVAPKC
jgi:hypothetical protein